MLITATLCLFAFGAVMVYSASAPGVLASGGSGASELIRYPVFGAVGLVVMHVIARRGVALARSAAAAAVLCVRLLLLVLVPGFVVLERRPALDRGRPLPVRALRVDEARARPLRGRSSRAPQRSGASRRPDADRDRRRRRRLLVVSQPDLGTTLVIAFTLGSMVVVAGVPLRTLADLVGIVVVWSSCSHSRAATQRSRLTSFLDPWAPATKRRRLPGGPGPDRARLGRVVRRRPRPRRAEGLLPPGGSDRLHPRRDRRGARRARHPRAWCSCTG